MELESYIQQLAEDYFGDDPQALVEVEAFLASRPYSTELACQLYFGFLDRYPLLVLFDGQCDPESETVFYNRGEDVSYFIANYEEFTQ